MAVADLPVNDRVEEARLRSRCGDNFASKGILPLQGRDRGIFARQSSRLTDNRSFYIYRIHIAILPQRTTKVTWRAQVTIHLKTGSFARSGGPLWYARHGHWFVGFKSPVRDRYLLEISIPNDHFKGTSTR